MRQGEGFRNIGSRIVDPIDLQLPTIRMPTGAMKNGRRNHMYLLLMKKRQ